MAKPEAPETARDRLRRYRENHQEEIDGAFLYRALADLETDDALAEVYRRLASTEERHAGFWAERMAAEGERVRSNPSRRARVLRWLGKRLGAGVLVATMRDQEKAGQYDYDDQPETEGETLRADERSHARLMEAISASGSRGIQGGVLARLEGRHGTIGGNALRAAVLGANDGLVSNLALVMGVAGAAVARTTVLISGLAGLLAGAASMALGEWLSVQSSRELHERQIEIERRELEEFPEEEQEELALIYQAKGLPENRARELAAQIMTDQASALDTMSREELGIDPEELGGSAWEAAFTSFFLFSFGAIFPVAPYFLLDGGAAVATSMIISGFVLFLVGGGVSLITGRSWWFSGLRQTILGLTAAAVTFGIGSLLGVAVGG